MKSKITVKRGFKWKCGECGKEFKYNSEKVRHEQSHVAKFECKVCSKKFSFLSAVRRHEKQHERVSSVQCDLCNHKFRDKTLLKRHMQYSHTGTFTCKKCDGTFHSEMALQTHMKTHKPISERKYRCRFEGCGKSFNFPHHLKHHELTHTNDKQHFCLTCGKGFIQLHHLKLHQKSHIPETWLPCLEPGCKKKFTNEYSRKRHLVTHKNKNKSGITSDSSITTADDINSSIKVSYLSCGTDEKKTDLHNDISNTAVETFYVFPLEEDDAVAKVLKNGSNVPKQTEVLKSDNIVSTVLSNMDLPTESQVASDTFKYSPSDENVMMDCNEEREETPKDLSVDKVDNSIRTCKAIIGCCIVTGSSEISSNCICAQMISNDEELKDLVQNGIVKEEKKEENILMAPEINNKDKVTDFIGSLDTNNEKCDKTMCDTCECANTCSKNPKNQIEVPITELKRDGTVKIIDAFDFGFEVSNNSRNGEKDLEYKIEEDIKMLSSNNCKEVLGNCIVSGNSTVNEDCICAKMSLNNEENGMGQEIDSITPNSL